MALPDDRVPLQPSVAGFDIRQQALPYLLRRAHARAEALFVEIMCIDDLTPRQITILLACAQTPGVTVSELADEVAVDLNTTSQLVRRLIDKGLLERRRSSRDGRAWAVHITATGQDVLSRVLPHNQELIEEIMRPLPPEYRPLFVKCLRLMLDLEQP